MGGLEMIAILVMLLMAPFICLQAYLLVWILGPAIKRFGRKLEEGRQQALIDQRGALEREYRRGVDDAFEGRVKRVQVTPALSGQDKSIAPARSDQYTITGRKIG